MYTTITIFYVSLAGIVLMVLLKRHEVRSGVPSLMSRIGAGTDHVFQAAYARVQKSLSYINRHTFRALAQWIAIHALKAVRAVYVEIKHRFISNPQGKKMIDAVRGRGEVKDHGASFYLREIGQDGPVAGQPKKK